MKHAFTNRSQLFLGLLHNRGCAHTFRYDMPLNEVPMIATHNSYNTEEEGVSTSWEVSMRLLRSITAIAEVGATTSSLDVGSFLRRKD